MEIEHPDKSVQSQEKLRCKVEAVRTLSAEPIREPLDEVLSEHQTTAQTTSASQWGRLRGAVLDESPPPPSVWKFCQHVEADLVWRRDGDDWLLLYRRRRMGRVVRDSQYGGMWRSVISRGQLSDMSNLSWAKNAVVRSAARELAEDLGQSASYPSKCPEKRGCFEANSSLVRQNAGRRR